MAMNMLIDSWHFQLNRMLYEINLHRERKKNDQNFTIQHSLPNLNSSSISIFQLAVFFVSV